LIHHPAKGEIAMTYARLTIIAMVALSLGGCASVPLATGLAVAGVGISAAALGVSAYHNCRADGGCKDVPLPK
jgi:uncharacterized protein YceK